MILDPLYLIDNTLKFMSPEFNKPNVRLMLLAIGIQESKFEHRKQVKGPALGFWQFEKIGVIGVMDHPSTNDGIQVYLNYYRLEGLLPEGVQYELEHNDILSCVFARLLLWQHPKPIPSNEWEAFDYYIEQWKPDPENYDENRKRWISSWAQAKSLCKNYYV